MPRALSAPAAIAILLGALAAPASAQPTELFFSEYVEGSSNNKALEIYNGTGAAVDLAAGGYNVQMFFNGSAAGAAPINLIGTIAAGDVFVLAHGSADSAILVVADQTSTVSWYNGDDAVVLRRGTTVIDVIGQVGFDPGTEWGTGVTSTADNTIRRNLSVVAGDADGSNAFDPSAEWTGFANNTFDGLGCHTAAASCPGPPPALAAIWEIQGAALASPVAGQARRTEGNVVTAVFTDGFFIQAQGVGDGDPDTSDGLFVFTGSAPAVAVGDEVTATGTVAEFFNMTELNASEVTVTGSGRPLPAAVTFDADTPSPDQPQPAIELERFEGMLVRVLDGIVSSPTDEFHEASVVVGPQRPFREPGILYPGLSGLPVWDGNREIFEIDTDRYLAAPRLEVAAGATVTAEGPLAFSFGDYQIWPTSLTVEGAAAVRPVRARAAGEFTIGSQNVLRLFDTEDDPDIDDPLTTPEAYALKLAKLSLQVRQVLGAPDVLAVQEVENLTALQDLAARIQADDPTIVYTAYLQEGFDPGGIDVGFLVRPTIQVDSVQQIGRDEIFEWPGNEPDELNDRPPLLLRGSYVGNGAPFPIAVIAVHQRSLNGIEGSDSARIRAKRHEQALRLSRTLEAMQDAEPGLRLVAIGDFNAFEFTDGYVDVMGQVTGNPDPLGAQIPATDEITVDLTNQTLNLPAEERYSFVFDGSAQSLDHAITSAGIASWLRGTEHSRGNADAPFAFAADGTTALRSADHDGTVVFVMTDFDGDGVADDTDNCRTTANADQANADGDPAGDVCDSCPSVASEEQGDADGDGLGDACDACAGTVFPEDIPRIALLPNRYALVDGDRVFDTFRLPRNAPAFTLDDTRGCSCGQIVDALGAPGRQRLFGCSLRTMLEWVGE